MIRPREPGDQEAGMRSCMFVDHSSVVRKVARRILSGSGMIVAEAESGAVALDICAAGMPDLIVVDTSLPDMSVADFIRAVRSIPSRTTPQILVSLVEKDVASIMRAKRAGAQGYLLKPFDRTRLLNSLHALRQAAA